MTAPTRPVLRWHGSKWRIADWVMAHFPPHLVYCEAFGGSAAVLLQKQPARSEIYNDRDGEVVNLFRVLRDQPDALARAIALTPYARDEYDGLYEQAEDSVERARRLIARSFMGQNSKGAFAKSGFDTRFSPDGFQSRARSLAQIPDQITLVAERLARVVIENDDGLAVARRADADHTLHFFDPPYLPETRSGAYYSHEMTAADHVRLLGGVCALRGMVVVSGYPSELYNRALTGWKRVERSALTDGQAKRTEVLWINPAAAARLCRPAQQSFLMSDTYPQTRSESC